MSTLLVCLAESICLETSARRRSNTPGFEVMAIA